MECASAVSLQFFTNGHLHLFSESRISVISCVLVGQAHADHIQFISLDILYQFQGSAGFPKPQEINSRIE